MTMRHGLGIALSVALALVPGIAVAQPAARGDHIALEVADVDASARFYADYFGLTELPVPVKGPRWLALGDTMALHLIGGRKVPVADNRAVHLALSVRDYDGLVVRLKAAKRNFFSFDGRLGVSESGRGDGVRQLFLRDPDGYWIEVNDLLTPRRPQKG